MLGWNFPLQETAVKKHSDVGNSTTPQACGKPRTKTQKRAPSYAASLLQTPWYPGQAGKDNIGQMGYSGRQSCQGHRKIKASCYLCGAAALSDTWRLVERGGLHPTMSPSIMGTWLYGPCFTQADDLSHGPKTKRWDGRVVAPEKSRSTHRKTRPGPYHDGRVWFARSWRKRPSGSGTHHVRVRMYMGASLRPPHCGVHCCHAGLLSPGLLETGGPRAGAGCGGTS